MKKQINYVTQYKLYDFFEKTFYLLGETWKVSLVFAAVSFLIVAVLYAFGMTIFLAA